MNLSRNSFFLAILIVAVFAYLLLGTGLHGDDYAEIFSMKRYGFMDFINPDPVHRSVMVFSPSSYYTLWWLFSAFGLNHQWVYDVMKIIVHLFAFFFAFKFFQWYLPYDRAVIASILFLFYPLHDATTYWYMALVYIIASTSLLYAHSLIRDGKYAFGFIMSLFGSFAFYSSPPYVFGLAAIFIIEKKYTKALLFTIPGFLYIAFYLFIKKAYSGIEVKINSSLNLIDFFRQLVLQLLSFIDVAIGPSFWLKIYYSVTSIGVFSAIFSTCIVVILFIKSDLFSFQPKFSKSLFIGLFCILLFSFGIYAITGLYQHSSFNLGNRSTVYASLLIASLLAYLPLNKKTIILFAFIFIFPVFGLSDYWKSWNTHQKAILENIQKNSELKTLDSNSLLLVTGNIYSKLGVFSHIEFFSMPWLVNSVFRDWVKSKDIVALTPYLYLDKGVLIDPKFDGKYHLSKQLYVYNSDTNAIIPVSYADVPQLLAARPREIRHWVQLAKGTWIESSIVALSPRLSYLFRK